jgi:VWFA-related protein
MKLAGYIGRITAAASISFAGTLAAQAPTARQAAAPPTTAVLHAEAQLVIVDVTVHDKDGHPVHGLKREAFTLTEAKEPQIVSHFEEHSTLAPPAAGPELPPMPPGTFADYTAVPPDGALNILLLDTLNTPMADQSYVRSELQQFVKKVKPGTRIAIFGLSQKLFLLQGFSSDPQMLRDAVEHKIVQRPSSLLDDAIGSDATPDAQSDMISAMAVLDGGTAAQMQIVSNLQQFEAEQKAFLTQLRIQYTLDAFNALAHYLSAFPGRKNLIWFSDSFPIDILPDPTVEKGFAVMEENSPEFRETTDLLSKARVSVYPVDAGGLRLDPTISAGAKKGDPFGKSLGTFYQDLASEHLTMNQLAEDTGGAAFYNNNDLASAVQNAIDSGSNYYTLTYTPSDKNSKGTFRDIRIALDPNLQAAGYAMSYRRGYYSEDRDHAAKTTTFTMAAATNTSNMYARAAMAHGAPTPQEILFKVRVLPIGTALEQTVAPSNNVDPEHPIKPPFRRFAVDLVAVSNDIQLILDKDGRRTGSVEFTVLLYDNDGVLLNATGNKLQLDLTPETYKRFALGLNSHFEISVPVKGGEDFLRIGVHDITANRFGVVELPLISVARLPPLPAPK